MVEKQEKTKLREKLREDSKVGGQPGGITKLKITGEVLLRAQSQQLLPMRSKEKVGTSFGIRYTPKAPEFLSESLWQDQHVPPFLLRFLILSFSLLFSLFLLLPSSLSPLSLLCNPFIKAKGMNSYILRYSLSYLSICIRFPRYLRSCNRPKHRKLSFPFSMFHLASK